MVRTLKQSAYDIVDTSACNYLLDTRYLSVLMNINEPRYRLIEETKRWSN